MALDPSNRSNLEQLALKGLKLLDVLLEEEIHKTAPSELGSEKIHSSHAVHKELTATDLDRTLSAHSSEKVLSEKSASVIGTERTVSAKGRSVAEAPRENVTVRGTGA